MKRRLARLWVVLTLFVPGACAALPSPSQEAAIAGYEAEQLACVEEAGTRLEADRCRCAVHQKYGRPCTWLVLDGGLNDAR